MTLVSAQGCVARTSYKCSEDAASAVNAATSTCRACTLGRDIFQDHLFTCAGTGAFVSISISDCPIRLLHINTVAHNVRHALDVRKECSLADVASCLLTYTWGHQKCCPSRTWRLVCSRTPRTTRSATIRSTLCLQKLILVRVKKKTLSE